MRRFITSLLGKAVCNVTIVALVLPTLSFLFAGKVDAQIQQVPMWAVVSFESKTPEIGNAAADAIRSALTRLPGIEVGPQETTNRTIESLGLQQPVTETSSLMRLGAELRAVSIVTGSVVDYRVMNSGGGKKAEVIMRVVVIDVASGLPVNGAAVRGSSSVRTGDSDDMTVLNEALMTAASTAIAEVRSKNLPSATVLNTQEKDALINQGTRIGLKVGMELIVTRGRQQVATAHIQDVEPDSAIIRYDRVVLGVQPGDRVRAIFEVPHPKAGVWPEGNGVSVVRTKARGGNNKDFGTLLAVLLIGAVLFGGDRGSNFSPATMESQAQLYPDFSGSPAVRLKWKRDSFIRGNQTTVQWQVHRNDILGSPVMVVPGDFGEAIDDNLPRDISYATFTGIGDTGTCTASLTTTDVNVAGVIAGRPYTYSLELVYKIAAIDYPGTDTSTGGTGGGTGGNTGLTTGEFQLTTTTTGQTNGGGNNGGGTAGGYCYFISKRVNAPGLATPLDRAALLSPAPNATIATDVPFSFISVVNPAYPINVEYCLEISTDPNFTKGHTKVYSKFLKSDTGTISTGNVPNLLSRLGADFGTTTTAFFWRIGARNVADKPGPKPDLIGEKYVFGAPRAFSLPSAPPPPPQE